MPITMQSSDFKAVTEPVLNKIFLDQYDLRKDEWKQVFTEKTGPRRSFLEETVLYAFGAAPEIAEGGPVTYVSGGQLYSKRYTFPQYGLAFALTKMLIEDSEHISLGSAFSKALAKSLVETKETLLTNHLNRAFNPNFQGGDLQPLNSAAHPIKGGTFSNLLTTPAALSHTSLEQMITQLRTAVDNNGKRTPLIAKKLVISPANEFTAEVILSSAQKSGTANNDINAIKSLKKVSEGAAVITRLTSDTAWWIQTDADQGLQLIMRRPLEKSMEGDFETDSMRYKATERYGSGWTDPRCMWGTPGL